MQKPLQDDMITPMKKVCLLVLLFFIFVSLAPLSVFADGSVANVTISKTVLHPKTNTYVKILSLGDATYQPGNTITFHITLANTGRETVPQIIVRDTFPRYLTFESGAGSFDAKNNMLSFLAYNLKPDTSQSFAISAQVVPANQFPDMLGQQCLSNKADITFGKNQHAQDEAKFCITISHQTVQKTNPMVNANTSKQVYPPVRTQSTPSTGTPIWMIPLLIVSACTGIFIIKKTGTTSRPGSKNIVEDY